MLSNSHICYSLCRSIRDRADVESSGEQLVKSDLEKYRDCEKFTFKCASCKTENTIAKPIRRHDKDMVSVLDYCENQDCSMAPIHQLQQIRNQLTLAMRKCIQKFYRNGVKCDEPNCKLNTRTFLHVSYRSSIIIYLQGLYLYQFNII